MTDSNWAIPGAGVFLRKPTAAQEQAGVRHKTALESSEDVRAQRDREVAVLHARHAWMLANAPHPILAALVEAHGPHRDDDRWPDCAACPPNSDDYGDEPASWPCGVWSFISDRMGDT
jgi:hypothetical protein